MANCHTDIVTAVIGTTTWGDDSVEKVISGDSVGGMRGFSTRCTDLTLAPCPSPQPFLVIKIWDLHTMHCTGWVTPLLLCNCDPCVAFKDYNWSHGCNHPVQNNQG
jgi:hypothetical protein